MIKKNLDDTDFELEVIEKKLKAIYKEEKERQAKILEEKEKAAKEKVEESKEESKAVNN